MMLTRRRLLELAMTGGTCSALASCADPHGAARYGSTEASLSGRLAVYSGYDESTTRRWASEFTASTGVKVSLTTGDSGHLAQQVITQGKNGPDVFLGAQATSMALLQSESRFAPLGLVVTANVSTAYRPSTDKWIGVAACATVFAHRSLPSTDLPRGIVDLVTPAWRQRWAVWPRDPWFEPFVATLLQLRGEDATRSWLKGVKASAMLAAGPDDLTSMLAGGTVQGALSCHTMWLRRLPPQSKTAPIRIHHLRHYDPGAALSLAGGGVLRSTKNHQAAVAFLGHITGHDGQRDVLDGSAREYPVGRGAGSGRLPSLESLKAPTVDYGTLDGEGAFQLMQEAGLL